MIFLLVFAQMAIASAANACVRQTELRIPTGAGHVLAGVLEHPGGTEPAPTVVMVSGAGPHVRDYSTAISVGLPVGWDRENHAFARLSTRLVARGYAVVGYDKVGTGRSTGTYDAVATTSTLADDVQAIVSHLRQRRDVDRNRIIILGHSEGGAIALLAASRDRGVAGVITMAAPAYNGSRIMQAQHRWLLEQLSDSDRAAKEKQRQLLMAEHEQRIQKEPWYRFFLTYDPLVAARQVHTPALILQGRRDWQVTWDQASTLANAIRSNGNRRITLRVFNSTDHAFVRETSSDDPAPLEPEVVKTIEQWLVKEFPPRIGHSCRPAGVP